MATNMNPNVCILCNNATEPKKRAYLKNLNDDPLFSLKQLLKRHYAEEKVLRCLKEPVICCKGACQTSIRKLSKLKHELQTLENDVVGKFAVMFEDTKSIDMEGPSTPTTTGRSVLCTPESLCPYDTSDSKLDQIVQQQSILIQMASVMYQGLLSRRM